MSYYEFSEIYDQLMQDIPYEKWADFIMNKIGKQTSILEAACGTGNVTKYLATEDYKITAFDLSTDMLVKAHEKLRKQANVELLNLDMKDFKLSRTFDAAICCCDGINYLIEEVDVSRFFQNVFNHLNKNGIFIFDYSNLYKFETFLGNQTIVSEEDNVFMIWENSFDEESLICEMEINFFCKDAGDCYRRIIEYQKQRTFKPEYIQESLLKSGFSNLEFYEGYSDEDLNDMRQRTVVVCRRND
ncbi:MAG: class I SAM-dependent methyltransferase [Tissierellales bacterium]|nr:class I SAM-dependent methyltransferase [Tissierellales bacterium]MBN2826734.1 class I SAM-dependent methyltransferase [Tissierellales bacterium]